MNIERFFTLIQALTLDVLTEHRPHMVRTCLGMLDEDRPLPFPDRPEWLLMIFFCLTSDIPDIGRALIGRIVDAGQHVEQLTRALALLDAGQPLRAAYVARGPAAYDDLYREVATRSVPPRVVEEAAALPAPATLLELGCGTGLIGQVLRAAGYGGGLIGLDLVEEMLTAVPPGLYDHLVADDALSWLCRYDGTVHGIVSFNVFVHFTPDVAAEIVAQAARILGPNGFLAFNAAESPRAFTHHHPLAMVQQMVDTAGLELEAVTRGAERTTYLCRKF